MGGYIDHIVHPATNPVVAVLVSTSTITRELILKGRSQHPMHLEATAVRN